MDKKDEGNGVISDLFKSSELCDILFENASEAIFFTQDSKIIDCNLSAFSLFGFEAKTKLIGLRLTDLSPTYQPDGSDSSEKYAQLISENDQKTIQKFEWECLKSDGTPFQVDVTLNSFEYENRNYQQITLKEISLRKNDANNQTNIEKSYQKIFENVQDVFYQTNLNGIITKISPSIKRYSNYITEDVVGQPIENFYCNPEERQILLKEISEKGEILDYEILLKGTNNQQFVGSINAHFTYDKEGNISGIEGAIRDITERKRTEEKLKLSLSLIQATLDSTTDGILVVDRLGKITSYNKQFKTMFLHLEEVLDSAEDSAAIESVLSQLKDPDQFVSKVKYLYEHPEMESFDTIELKDGRVLERFSCPQRLDDKPIGRVWNFRDITLRRKAEQQMQLMAHTIKSINECISITDIEDRILFINESFLKTYGFTEENELIGQDISIVRSTNNDPEIVSQILSITTNTGWQGEILNKRKDGTDFPISLSTSVVQNENGEVLGMVGVAVDITESKKAEIELRRSEERYRNLIETMPDGVYRSTPEGKFMEVNPAMVKILGYDSKEELMAIDIKSQLYFSPSDREKLISNYELEDLDIYPLKKKDGTAVWMEDHGWYVKDENGNIIFHEGVARDVTDRKKSEIEIQNYSEQLKELNASKDKFFSIIAHDLKSPFNSILGLSEILKNDAKNLDIEIIEQYAGIIHSTSKNTFRLLENLLDWARLQQAQMPFLPVSLILKTIVDEVVELMIEKANSKMIAIINYIPANLIVISDANMLKTIFRNLISNALKFTSFQGKIEISAISLAGEIEISVKDTGTGINKKNIDHLFKVGSNYSKSGTENEKGTGLGLLLCKEFVEIHNGRIWVESEEGIGSEFKFTMPTA